MSVRWLFLSVGLSGCAAFANLGASADMAAGFLVAQQRAAVAEAAVQKMDDRVAEIEEVLRVQGLDRASGQQTVEQMSQQLGVLRGSMEELQFALKDLRADFDAYQQDQERRVLHAESRLEQIERMLALTAPPPPRADGTIATPPTPVGPTDPVIGSASTPEAAAATFDDRIGLAEQRMKDGQQAAARAILESALAAEPTHARVAEAKYRVAETWFNEGKFREAARAFQGVLDLNDQSAWAPWSMLRIGECFEGMGRPKDARPFYDGVIRKYPNSDAAKEAKKKVSG